MDTARHWIGYASAAGAALLCTLIGLAMVPRFDIVNIAMVYLLAVVVIALRFSRGASRSHQAPTAASACWAALKPRTISCRWRPRTDT